MVVKKTLFPLIKKKLGLFLTLIFICGVGFIFGAGFVSVYIDFKQGSSQYINEYGLPDITMYTNEFSNDIGSQIKVDGCEISYRYQELVTMKINNKSYTSRVTTFDDNSFAKRYVVSEVDDSADKYNLNLDYVFAKNNNITAGTEAKITYTYQGVKHENIECYINKLVGNPEAIYTYINSYLPQDKYDFGYTYVRKDHFKKFGQMNNQLIVKLTDSNISKQEIRDKIIKTIEEKGLGVTVSQSVYKEESAAYTFIDSVCNDLKKVAVAVPLVFLVIVLVLVFLFVYQVTKSLTHEFGIMLALGVSNASMVGLLLGFSVVITIFSSIIGVIGAHITSSITYGIFKYNYAIPTGYSGVVPYIAAIAFGIILLVTCLSSLLTLVIVKRVSPKEAINNVKDKDNSLPKVIETITNKVSPSNKIAVSSICKNVTRSIVSIFAIVSMFIISFSSIRLNQSENGIITQLKARNNYDAEMFLFNNNDISDIEKFVEEEKTKGNISEYEHVIHRYFEIEGAGYTFTGIENNDMHVLEDANHNRVEVIDNCVVLDESYADEIGAKVGDVFTINPGIELKVNAIAHICTYKKQYLTFNTFKSILEARGVPSSDYLLSFSIRANDLNAFLNDIGALDLNVHTLTTSTYIASITGGTSSIVLLSEILVVLSCLLGFAGLVIMAMTSLNEQRRKFSIMQALGLKKSDISKVLLKQDLFYLLTGLIIGIPSGYFISKLLVKMCTTDGISLFYYNGVWVYFFVIALIVGVIGICHLISMISISRTNISNNTRARE